MVASGVCAYASRCEHGSDLSLSCVCKNEKAFRSVEDFRLEFTSLYKDLIWRKCGIHIPGDELAVVHCVGEGGRKIPAEHPQLVSLLPNPHAKGGGGNRRLKLISWLCRHPGASSDGQASGKADDQDRSEDHQLVCPRHVLGQDAVLKNPEGRPSCRTKSKYPLEEAKYATPTSSEEIHPQELRQCMTPTAPQSHGQGHVSS